MLNSLFFPNIHATIRLQMLSDIANKIDAWETRAKAANLLLDGCYVNNELEARILANHWYECLTHIDLPVLETQ